MYFYLYGCITFISTLLALVHGAAMIILYWVFIPRYPPAINEEPPCLYCFKNVTSTTENASSCTLDYNGLEWIALKCRSNIFQVESYANEMWVSLCQDNMAETHYLEQVLYVLTGLFTLSLGFAIVEFIYWPDDWNMWIASRRKVWICLPFKTNTPYQHYANVLKNYYTCKGMHS